MFIAVTDAGLLFLLYLPPTHPNINSVVVSLFGEKNMLISWGELKSYHLAQRVNIKAGVEQELLEMGSGE